MSSSEQAPEPTMDEILASIRKIIADDEDSPSPAPDAAAEQAARQPGLADDIANVLNQNSRAPEPAAAAENEDDIFDLTNALHDTPEPLAPPADPAPVDPYASAPPAPVAPAPYGAAPTPEPPASAAFPLPVNEPVAPPQSHDILAGAPMEESVLQETTTGFGGAEPQPQAGGASWEESHDAFSGNDAQPDESGTDSDHAEITDLDSFAPGQSLGASDDLVEAAYAESEVVAGRSASDEAMGGMPGLMSGSQPAEMEHGEAGEDAFMERTSGGAPEPVFATPEPAAEAPQAVITPPPPASAVASEEEAEAGDAPEAAASGKTLEDSVKDMLRPMLREWLDDNMQRIVEDAVKDELHNKHNQF